MSLQEVIGLTDQPRNLVSEFKRRLQAQIGFNCFELWFNAVDSIYQDGTSLAVSAADEFSMDRIKSSYGEKINRIAGEMAIAPIRFVVQAGDTGRSNGSTASEKAISSNPLDAVTADKSPKSVQVLKLVSNSGQTCSGNPDSARKSPSIQAKTEKPIKHSGARFRYSLRDFVFDSENQILRIYH